MKLITKVENKFLKTHSLYYFVIIMIYDLKGM